MEDKKVIGVVQVLQHLKDGMTRNEIAAHYGITKSECKMVFMDVRLKGKKTIKKPTFTLVDDADLKGVDVKVADTEDKGVETIEVVDDADPVVDDTAEKIQEVAKATWED